MIVPEGKQCEGCDAAVAELTFWEQRHNMKYRLWNLKKYWGDLCGWCGRMSRVRFAHLSMPSIKKFLATPYNKDTFKMYTLCYITIRQEGRTQVIVEMLESRLGVLQQCRLALQKDSVNRSSLYMYMTLEEYSKTCFEDQLMPSEYVQMSIDGKERIGVKLLKPQPKDRKPIEVSYLALDSRLRTDVDEDLQYLKQLDTKAASMRPTLSTAGSSSGLEGDLEASPGMKSDIASATKGAPLEKKQRQTQSRTGIA